jgi:hypothetical protein
MIAPQNTTDVTESKWCTSCGIKKALEQFHVDADKPDGHRDTCKECRKKLDEVDLLMERSEAATRQLIALEEEAVARLKEMQTGGTLTPHINELLESIMNTFDGVNGFARTLHATFRTAKPGSQNRVKILALIVQLTQAVTRADLAQQQLEDADEADIKHMMVEALIEWQKRTEASPMMIPDMQGEVIDVTPTVEETDAEESQ